MKQLIMNIGKSIRRTLPDSKNTQHIRELLEHQSLVSRQLQNAQLEQFERELLKEERYADHKNLNRYERQVFSQFGEDGIIAEIFRRIGVGTRRFVEVGVGDGLENNTSFLLLQGWNGYWVEGDAAQVQAIGHHLRVPIAEGRLKVAHSFVTAEGIAETLQNLQVPDEVDLLSVDIDRNTYEVWAALFYIKARVVVVEYNASIPPDIDWKVEYHASRSWNGTNHFGASLKSYEELGRKMGYCLVGCNLAGANAFFVRQDLCEDKFVDPFTSENHYEPARYFLMRHNGHPPCLIDG